MVAPVANGQSEKMESLGMAVSFAMAAETCSPASYFVVMTIVNIFRVFYLGCTLLEVGFQPESNHCRIAGYTSALAFLPMTRSSWP